MTTFKHTDAALAFIRTADSRETSPRIMEAICAFAHDTATAVVIWEEGLTNWDETSRHAFIDMVTRDGADSPTDFCWGAAGVQWATDADAARARALRMARLLNRLIDAAQAISTAYEEDDAFNEEQPHDETAAVYPASIDEWCFDILLLRDAWADKAGVAVSSL